MNNLVLRKATAEDSGFAYLTKKTAFREYIEKSSGWNEEEQRGLHNRRFASQDFQVIQYSGVNVGILALVRLPDCVKINQMFILPEYQNKGIGAACLTLVRDTSGKRPIRLQVLKVNPRAAAFYQKHGFKQIGETDTHILIEKD